VGNMTSEATATGETDGSVLELFDAHLDLAYLELRRRNMLRPLDRLSEDEVGPHPPASVTLPELARANVRYALGTVFTLPAEAGDADADGADGAGRPEAYEAGDVEGAQNAGVDQLDVYRRWADAGLCTIATRGSFETTSAGEAAGAGAAPLLRIGVLVENADPIRTPDELDMWIDRGVVAISLTWARQGRYAAGNLVASDGVNPGLTAMGVELLEAMEEEKVVLDVSHLNDASLDDALSRFGGRGGRGIASHSNCRALVGEGDGVRDQRHLTDETIVEIGRRDGVIGLNLCAAFIERGADERNRPSMDAAAAHVERICELTGSTRHVGLGSDLDGGFSAARLPRGIDRAADMGKLLGVLGERGFSRADVEAFASGNWLRVLSRRD